MKKIVVGIMALIAAVAVRADYVQDFEAFTGGTVITSGSGSLAGTAADGTPILRTGGATGATGDRSWVDEGGNVFARMSRSYSTSASVSLGELITMSDAGLVSGTTYTLSFDYRIGVVGTTPYHNVDFAFGIGEASGYSSFQNIENSLNDMTVANGAVILNNYNKTTDLVNIPTGAVADWTTVTFAQTFTFSGSNPAMAWMVSAVGAGSGNAGYDALNHTYIDVDNVSIAAVPEPATVGLLGLGGLIALVARRAHRVRDEEC